ncbi:MAG: O-antigen ligase family protein [Betaproteobacteria bacterium]
MIGLLVVLMVPQKDRLLSAVFFLGLQMDVYLRVGYGRAGSTEGIAIPFVAIAGIALLAWRYFAFGPRHFRHYRFDGMARVPLLAILITTAVSIATTEERFIGVAQLIFELELFFIYWLTFNLVRNEADFRKVIGLLIFMLVAQSLVMYVESALGVNFNLSGEVMQRGEIPRPGGTVSSNPAGFSSFITPPLLVAMAYFFSRGKQWRPTGAMIAGMLGLAAIALTFTRASWAGVILGIAVLVVVLGRRRMMRWDRLAGIALILALAGLALMPIMMERLSHDYGAGNAQKAAWEERWGLMRIAFNMIAHHPLTGVGPGAYMYTYKEYIPPGLHQWVFAVHNEFLLRAAETGIAGAIAFFALIVAGFRSGIRLIRSQRIEFITVGAGWIAALASLVWQMSWVPWTGFTYNAMLWFMLGLTDAVCRFDDTKNVKAESVRTYLKRAPGLPSNAEMKA